MRDHPLIRTVATFALMGALGVLALSLWEPPPAVDRRLHQAVGVALARQALNLRQGDQPMTIVTRDTSAFPQPALDIQLASFRRALREAKASPPVIHALQTDPLRPVEVPAGDFFEWIRQAAPGSVIVSFMGPPLLSDAQRTRLGAVKARIVAFCGGNLPERAYLKVLFAQGLLHAAVVERARLDGSANRSVDQQNRFDRRYLVITSANLGELDRAWADSPVRTAAWGRRASLSRLASPGSASLFSP